MPSSSSRTRASNAQVALDRLGVGGFERRVVDGPARPLADQSEDPLGGVARVAVGSRLDHREEAHLRPRRAEERGVGGLGGHARVDRDDEDGRLRLREDEAQAAREGAQLPRRPLDRAFREDPEDAAAAHMVDRRPERRRVAVVEGDGDDAQPPPEPPERRVHHLGAHHPADRMGHGRLDDDRVEPRSVRRDDDEPLGPDARGHALAPLDRSPLEEAYIRKAHDPEPADEGIFRVEALAHPAREKSHRHRRPDERGEEEDRGDSGRNRGHLGDGGWKGGHRDGSRARR